MVTYTVLLMRRLNDMFREDIASLKENPRYTQTDKDLAIKHYATAMKAIRLEGYPDKKEF